jgi:hypothetical protein
MSASTTSVEAICNAALDRIGYPESIAQIREGTRHARVAIRLYNQTRDDMLRKEDWGFPRRDATLTLLKSAPAGGYVPGFTPWTPASNPPMPYLYEYAYPADCLMLRAIKPPQIFQPVFTAYPNVFEVANDAVPLVGQTVAPGRVILCYLPNAMATYCGQVVDMSQWDVGFIEALIDKMAAGLAPALARVAQSESETAKANEIVSEMRGIAAVGRQG